MDNKDELLARFKTTLDILKPTFAYVDSLDDLERDFCEQTFFELSPCYLYMYSIVVDKKIPAAYQEVEAQYEMFEKIKFVASISAIEYKRLRAKLDSLDTYQKGFYALLETFLLLYYAYNKGL